MRNFIIQFVSYIRAPHMRKRAPHMRKRGGPVAISDGGYDPGLEVDRFTRDGSGWFLRYAGLAGEYHLGIPHQASRGMTSRGDS
jgi:hypothetical protein